MMAAVILEELQKSEEFTVGTPITKETLSHIELLKDTDEIEGVISYMQVKVKELLLPMNMPKFHQKLHQFRAYDLPIFIKEQEKNGKFHVDICNDMILWQCLLDKVLSNELSRSKCSAVRATKCHRVLSQVEQNAVRYTAGFVIRKLIEKNKFDAEKSDILKGFLKDKSSIDDSNDSSEQWLKTSDRGGLKLITDLAFELFTSGDRR